MRKVKIKNSRCSDCSDYMTLSGTDPKKVKKRMLYPGERYCMAGKSIRSFKKSDPKTKPPKWCPRRLKSSILRIYQIEDPNKWVLFHMLRKEIPALTPQKDSLTLRLIHPMSLSARQLYEAVNEQKAQIRSVLGQTVHQYEVLEVYDGICSQFFFYNGKALELIYGFTKNNSTADISPVHP